MSSEEFDRKAAELGETLAYLIERYGPEVLPGHLRSQVIKLAALASEDYALTAFPLTMHDVKVRLAEYKRAMESLSTVGSTDEAWRTVRHYRRHQHDLLEVAVKAVEAERARAERWKELALQLPNEVEWDSPDEITKLTEAIEKLAKEEDEIDTRREDHNG